MDTQTIAEKQFRYIVQLLVHEPTVILKACLYVPFGYEPSDQILCNGFQSWTETKLFSTQNSIANIGAIGYFWVGAFGDYHITPKMLDDKSPPSIPPSNSSSPKDKKQKPLHSWSYTSIQQTSNEEQVLFASLDEQNAYTLFLHHCRHNTLSIEKDTENLVTDKLQTLTLFDILVAKGKENQVFDLYDQYWHQNNAQIGITTREMTIQPKRASGWTSWYEHYTNISQQIVVENLSAFQKNKIPINFFQIDDGWQQQVGDWTRHNHKFSDGMHAIAQHIANVGFLPGLWLAPFICSSKSQIFREHPEWILKNEQQKKIHAGYNPLWRTWMYVLDFYNPDVQNYLSQVLQTMIQEWGFKMLKLDFLYAVALLPPKNKTRAQVMHQAMRWLRQTVGDKVLLLGCGVPLSPVFGVFDYCRIGPDVHTAWEMPLLKWLGSRERVSTVLALHNTVNRRQLNNRFFANDPDVSILRKKGHSLNPNQQFTLFFLNQLFGDLQFVSDNIDQYDEKTLKLYASQFPLQERQINKVIFEKDIYYIAFSIGKLMYEAYTNMSLQNKKINPSNLQKHVPNTYFFDCQKRQFLKKIPDVLSPAQTICLLLTPPPSAEKIYVAGSSYHLFAGSEVGTIASPKNENECHLHLHPQTQMQMEEQAKKGIMGAIWLRSAKPLNNTTINGKLCIPNEQEKDLFLLTIPPIHP